MTQATFKVTIDIAPDTDTVVEKTIDEVLPDDVAACEIIKSVEESRVTVGLAYPHSRTDKGVAADGHIDFAGRSAVEKACWSFTSKSRSIGIMHRNGTEGHGEVVESAIHRGPDWVIKEADGSQKTIVDGDWVMAVRWDQPTWALIKSGRLNGLSPQGRGQAWNAYAGESGKP